jgi:hypothetical protein
LITGRIAKVAPDKLLNIDRVAEIVSEVWDSQFGPLDPEDLNERRQAFSSVARKIVA